MAESVGAIYYTVEAETAKLISDLENANKRLEMLESGFNKTDASARKADVQLTKTASAVRNLGNEGAGAERKIGGLVKMLGGLIAVQSIGGIISLAEGYNEYAERVRMATSSTDEYVKVQERLLATANGTYRALSEAQEVFITTSTSIKAMGYNTDEALDIVDSLSYSFVRNATSADKAKGALNAVSSSFVSGKVGAQAWMTVTQAIPTIVTDIANATGKTEKEILSLGVAGNLTARDLSEGLRKALDENKEAADNMATTVADAFTNLRNSLAVYVGEANRASGSTQLISSAIVSLGENIDLVVKSLMLLGAGALAKYIASQGLATMASLKQALAARQEAATALQAAQARNAAAVAALAHARANVGLTTSTTALAAAEKAATVAAAGLATAQRAASAASVGMLGILGGPAGVIAIAASVAAGFLLMGDNADKAVKDIDELTGSLDGLHQKQLELRKLDLEEAIRKNGEALEETSVSVNALRKDYEELHAQLGRGVSDDDLKNLTHTITEQEVELTKLADKHSRLETALLNVNSALQQAAASQRSLNQAMDDSPTDDYLKRLVDRKHALIDGNSATKQAERYIKTLNNVTPERIEQIRKEAAEIDRLAAAQRKSTQSRGAGKKAETEAERSYKQNSESLRKMAESFALAHLEGEQLAVVQARLSLNDYATPEQIESAEKLAIALHKVNEAQKLKTKVGSDPQAYIRGNDEPLSGGAFDDQVARYDAEDKREQERYEAKLVRLREAMEAEKLTIAQYHAELEAMQIEHAARLNQIDEARQSVMLSTAGNAFGQLASLIKNSQGEQSSAFKALFAVSKAFAIADAGLKLNMALMQVMADQTALTPMQKFANYAAVASAGAGVLSAISSASFGGRQYGGPTQPGKMYRINENGAPEVFNAANGQQFMLPNTRGHVVSNKDATTNESNGVSVVVNVHNAPPGTQVEQQRSDKELIIDVMIEDVATGGRFTEAGSSMLGWRRQGR
ncbi:tape measure protein [Alcaligenes aquatilis]|uniref:tape measure protein n=1 Tax=Alcaligenes aquatilis TaxID=323284 RepID=UPI000F66C329|nr:tape measure protein [Alcaligenes aquatilis]QXR37298.1 tape measure protein [Alcaligenes aquatilis]